MQFIINKIAVFKLKNFGKMQLNGRRTHLSIEIINKKIKKYIQITDIGKFTKKLPLRFILNNYKKIQNICLYHAYELYLHDFSNENWYKF